MLKYNAQCQMRLLDANFSKNMHMNNKANFFWGTIALLGSHAYMQRSQIHVTTNQSWIKDCVSHNSASLFTHGQAMMSAKSIACQIIVIFVLKAASVEAKGRYFAGLGGEKEGTFMTLDKLEAIGLSRDHRIYSHVVIPPWNRPFKPGYCESWEWHTDKKYRDQRLAICHELTEGKSCLFIFTLV